MVLPQPGEPSLLNNILVCALAEKYGFAELKEMVQVKFQDRAKSFVSAMELPEIFRDLYGSTSSSDGGLSDPISPHLRKTRRADH